MADEGRAISRSGCIPFLDAAAQHQRAASFSDRNAESIQRTHVRLLALTSTSLQYPPDDPDRNASRNRAHLARISSNSASAIVKVQNIAPNCSAADIFIVV